MEETARIGSHIVISQKDNAPVFYVELMCGGESVLKLPALNAPSLVRSPLKILLAQIA